MEPWFIYALVSAIFAGAVAVLATAGMKGIDSTLAMAIRVVVILPMTWAIVAWQGNLAKVSTLTNRNWTFLVLSAVATGLSWLFYFRALAMAGPSRVAPIDKSSLVFTVVLAMIFLGERPTLQTYVAAGLVAAGVIVSALKFGPAN
jgi:bacterial/archaeal transporter family protein